MATPEDVQSVPGQFCGPPAGEDSRRGQLRIPLLYTGTCSVTRLPSTFSAGWHASAPITEKVLDCPGQLK